MNGYITLGIIALLFLAMYAYAHGSVYFDLLIKKRTEKELRERQEALRRLKMQKQKQRDEKFQKLHKRSLEIKRRLKELEQERVLRTQAFKDKMKVDIIKNNTQHQSPSQQTG